MPTEQIRISALSLTTFVVDVLHAAGVPRSDGAIVADCLVTANMSGIDSHGVVRLAHYVRRLKNGSINACPKIRYKRLAPAAGYLDGGAGLGHVVADNAVKKAMELAAEAGAGTVSAGNSSHFGMAGFYALRLAAQGYIGMCMTPTDRLLIPFGGTQPFFGSNPICFGVPAGDIPVVLDMATTSIPYGKLALAVVEGRSIPGNWALDAGGKPTTDPNEAVGLLPASGPKGSGLAMIVDILGSLLADMPWGPHINRMYGDIESPRRLGHFFMAIDIRRFMPLDTFVKKMDAMLEELIAQEPAKGFERVCYPGQLEGERRAKSQKEGILLDPGLYEELRALAESINVQFFE